jgi:hypothetical protein
MEKQLLDVWTILGEQPLEPLEPENAGIRSEMAVRWMDVARKYAERSDYAAAERCRSRSMFLMPSSDPRLQELAAQ